MYPDRAQGTLTSDGCGHLPGTGSMSVDFDCVVMLTGSDWHTEMRSNRYHYATRFARTHPVYFVQPDLGQGDLFCERVKGHPNLSIVHVPTVERNILFTPLDRFLEGTHHLRPLLWCYNYRFAPFYCNFENSLRVYHATEDYFSWVSHKIPDLARVAKSSDVIICVSDGVRDSLENQVGPLPQAHVVTNGCDYGFYAKGGSASSFINNVPSPRAVYQGNIAGKVDVDLMLFAARTLPHVSFVLAGEVVLNSPGRTLDKAKWNRLKTQPNVHYLGKLSVDELRDALCACDVGLIPFVQEDWIVKPGFPLKTFEYLAAGLPVVSTPLDNLQPFKDIIHFAATPDQFVRGIQVALKAKNSKEVEHRLAVAKGQDYDEKFARVRALLSRVDRDKQACTKRKDQTTVNHVYVLVPGEPTLDAGFDLAAVSTEASSYATVIGLEREPEPERRHPVLEKKANCLVIRRPLVPVEWPDYLSYARELMACNPKGPGMVLGTLLTFLSIFLALVGVTYKTLRLMPVPMRTVIKRVLFATRSSQQEGKSQTGVKNARGRRGTLEIVHSVQTTHTLVHAVKETMVKPDIVHSWNFDSLLAGVMCKKHFGCKLIYEVHGSELKIPQGMNRLSSWLFTGLEKCLIAQTDSVIALAPRAETGAHVRRHVETMNCVEAAAKKPSDSGAGTEPCQGTRMMS